MPFSVPPYRLSGAVYGALLNHGSALQALGGAVRRPPYNAPPKAPVLYIKPRNTLAVSGDVVRIPAGTPDLEVSACVGLVLGRTACNVPESLALDYIAGYLIMADVSVPHSNYHRPSIRFKARDGYCPLGPAVTARAQIADPGARIGSDCNHRRFDPAGRPIVGGRHGIHDFSAGRCARARSGGPSATCTLGSGVDH
jgi:5-oxopent-3-ene-1,2,5-tricarboxylate decarboxylase/2-hydroxyhepta-2,4-diene-1,7-dioate isomerase